jgi:hypothetical protein
MRFLLKRILLLTWVFALHTSAWADEPRIIPRSDQVEAFYLSVDLWLKPCVDVKALGYADNDADARKYAANERNALPPGTCDNPDLVEKLFRARFLQGSAITMVRDPWNLNTKIIAQNAVIDRCKDTSCLGHALDAVIAELSPIYFDTPDPLWPRGTGLCPGKWTSISTKKALALLDSAQRKEIADAYGEDNIEASTCSGSHGKLMDIIGTMTGNQVNAPEWLYRLNRGKAETLLSLSSDGPFDVLESTCNGWPDLITSARINAGEHDMSYYRYNGNHYQNFYGNTEMGLEGAGDFSVAVYAGNAAEVPITCH